MLRDDHACARRYAVGRRVQAAVADEAVLVVHWDAEARTVRSCRDEARSAARRYAEPARHAGRARARRPFRDGVPEDPGEHGVLVLQDLRPPLGHHERAPLALDDVQRGRRVPAAAVPHRGAGLAHRLEPALLPVAARPQHAEVHHVRGLVVAAAADRQQHQASPDATAVQRPQLRQQFRYLCDAQLLRRPGGRLPPPLRGHRTAAPALRSRALELRSLGRPHRRGVGISVRDGVGGSGRGSVGGSSGRRRHSSSCAGAGISACGGVCSSGGGSGGGGSGGGCSGGGGSLLR